MSFELRRTLLPGILLACGVHTVAQEQTPPAQPTTTFVVNVTRVLIPVVVRDKQGNAVPDLKQEDFKVFNSGKPQEISRFSVEKREPPATVVATAKESSSTAAAEAKPASSAPVRFIVFLFDDLHLSADDLVHAKKASTKMLGDALGDSDMAAVVSISGRTNSGVTRDKAKLAAAITSIEPRGLYKTEGSECPNIGYYQADLIVNKHNDTATASAIQQVFDCDPGLDKQRDINVAERLANSAAMRVVTLGQQDVQITNGTIAEIVKRMGGLPGQRILIFVSSGFLSIDQQSLTTESRIIDLAAQSDVTISALDARGLYTSEISASEHSPSLGGQSMQLHAGYRRTSMESSENAMSSLADGTGGTYFHNSNDLNAGFKSLTEAPEYLYLLEISLNNVKPDGAFHPLKVTVNRPDTSVEARRGYFMPKPEKKK
jgi:VWFA-related protein